MSPTLPEKGLWHVADRRGADDVPFDLIKLDLRGRGSGAVRARNLETLLRRVRRTGPDSFIAAYEIRGHRGEVEAVSRPDGSLWLSLTGTLTTTLVALAVDPVVVEAPAPWRALSGAIEALCRPAEMAHGAVA